MAFKFVMVGVDGEDLDSNILLEPDAITLLSRGGTSGTPSSQNQDYSAGLRLILKRLRAHKREIRGVWVDSTVARRLSLSDRQIFFPEDINTNEATLFSLLGKRMERVGKAPGSDPDKGNRNKRIRIETGTGSVGELSSVIGARPAEDVPRSALRLPANDLRKVTESDIWSAIEGLRDGSSTRHFDDSLGYDLVTADDIRFPPKAVFGLAASSALGFPVRPVNFTGGLGTICFELLEAAGWEVVVIGAPTARLEADGDSAEMQWPEGDQRRRLHLRRERHPGVAKAKKAEQRRIHGRLFCEQCQMDPVAFYGNLDGEACIEVHHRATEVASMQPGHLTRLQDLECLCANCHRVRHRLMRRTASSDVGLRPGS